ncbi:TPA: hypothetical protein R6376_001033 [Klebsiella pneumoniae]|nr:hypothetical protein [Klebsiella pneumoniae]HEE1042841.1 hypothetical protein [Klebsiella pneumoniae]
MTTDITELAPAMKAAAIDAKELAIIARYSKGRAAAEKFYAMANPANILALVEALEKAQAGEKQWHELVDAFCADDADWHKLTNSNNELIALLSQVLCKQADRIAELESRTVKLPEPFKLAKSSSGLTYYYADEVDAALTAAGIKVEAE